MKNPIPLLLALLILLLPLSAHAEGWTKESKALLEKMTAAQEKGAAAGLKPGFVPTADGKSFVLVWYAGKELPKKWLVSLHGTKGNVFNDFLVWQKSIAGRDIGFIALQWWIGEKEDEEYGETIDIYYTPPEIYAALGPVLESLHAAPRSVLLEGFSRGSSNVYAVAAEDHVKGKGYFGAVMANSGGAMMDYPPTRAVNRGAFGTKPFDGLNWMTSCGGKDPRPQRDGCPAMQRTADWLEKMGGAVVLKIEDPQSGHGALNLNPANATQMLDAFLK